MYVWSYEIRRRRFVYIYIYVDMERWDEMRCVDVYIVFGGGVFFLGGCYVRW